MNESMHCVRRRDAMSAHKLIFNPIYIVSDFESSLPEAINLQFPNATHMGCHFHFGQALWRRVQAVGLVTKYREEQPVRTFIECCNAFAFIPIGEVSIKFSELVAQLSDSDKGQLAPFIDYFKLTWLSGTFPLQLWNKYGCDKHHRTNNAMENWHGRINKLLPTHPNIFIFINAIKDDQANAQITMAKADVGQSPPPSKPKYRKLEDKLTKAYEKHVSGVIDTNQFLRKVQHCVNVFKD